MLRAKRLNKADPEYLKVHFEGLKGYVICIVWVLLDRCERPPHACLWTGGVPNYPVDNDVEEKTRHNTTLLDASLYRKPIWCSSVFNNTAGASIVKLLYAIDEVVRDAIMPENVPELVSTHTMKGLLEIDETNVQGCLPFSTKIFLRMKICSGFSLPGPL